MNGLNSASQMDFNRDITHSGHIDFDQDTVYFCIARKYRNPEIVQRVACPDCNKSSLESTIRCIFPDFESLRLSPYDFIIYKGNEDWTPSHFAHLIIGLRETAEFTYNDAVEDFIYLIRHGESRLWSSNNNDYPASGMYERYHSEGISEEEKRDIENMSKTCICMLDDDFFAQAAAY